MTITSEINRIKSNVENTYTALANKGASMPIDRNTNNLVSTINSLGANVAANTITALNCTGEILAKNEKVWISTTNPTSGLKDGNYYIVDFVEESEHIEYTGLTAAACDISATVDVITVLDVNTMTIDDTDDFTYEIIV